MTEKKPCYQKARDLISLAQSTFSESVLYFTPRSSILSLNFFYLPDPFVRSCTLLRPDLFSPLSLVQTLHFSAVKSLSSNLTSLLKMLSTRLPASRAKRHPSTPRNYLALSLCLTSCVFKGGGVEFCCYLEWSKFHPAPLFHSSFPSTYALVLMKTQIRHL